MFYNTKKVRMRRIFYLKYLRQHWTTAHCKLISNAKQSPAWEEFWVYILVKLGWLSCDRDMGVVTLHTGMVMTDDQVRYQWQFGLDWVGTRLHPDTTSLIIIYPTGLPTCALCTTTNVFRNRFLVSYKLNFFNLCPAFPQLWSWHMGLELMLPYEYWK